MSPHDRARYAIALSPGRGALDAIDREGLAVVDRVKLARVLRMQRDQTWRARRESYLLRDQLRAALEAQAAGEATIERLRLELADAVALAHEARALAASCVVDLELYESEHQPEPAY